MNDCTPPEWVCNDVELAGGFWALVAGFVTQFLTTATAWMEKRAKKEVAKLKKKVTKKVIAAALKKSPLKGTKMGKKLHAKVKENVNDVANDAQGAANDTIEAVFDGDEGSSKA